MTYEAEQKARLGLAARLGVAAVAWLLAALLWLPCVQLFFRPGDDAAPAPAGPAPPQVGPLLLGAEARWQDSGVQALLRGRNPEWDFMARTYLTLARVNLALREPERQAEQLARADALIADTLALEQEHGPLYFLLGYAQGRRWKLSPPRSVFVDGEIALMLAARCLVEDRADYRAELAARVEELERRLRQSPVLSGESYPDECWLFCNTVALAAFRLSDALGNRDQDRPLGAPGPHAPFLREWVTLAKQRLVHEESGLLISKYPLDAGGFTGQPVDWQEPIDGPEGSSIWMSAHMLQVVDPEFARDQYERARRELGVTLLGFGYAREWPRSWENAPDVDSGPIVPGVEASAGSSGLAILGAAAFGDRAYLQSLLASLDLAAFPLEGAGGDLSYAASNTVGDAVLIYALAQGPLWELVTPRPERSQESP